MAKPPTIAEAGAQATMDFTCRRNFWSGSGRWGSPSYWPVDGEDAGWSIPVQEMIGHLVGDGGRVRVTVEVLEAGWLTENTHRPPRPTLTWAEYEDYCTRGPVTIHEQGSPAATRTGDRLVQVGPRRHDDPADAPLGLRFSVGYGGGWVALADIAFVEIAEDDESSAALLNRYGIRRGRSKGE